MDKNYRKKPIVIKAVLVADALRAAQHDWQALPEWLRTEYEMGCILFRPEGIDILTREGVMTGLPTDYLIRGVAGELYPCKPDIFEQTYEAVTE